MIRKTLVALAASLLCSGSALAETAMPFALDWKFEGPAAPYFLAIDEGHFEAADLDVTISAGKGSLDAIPKVATGAFPVGFADINSLVKFLDQNPGAPVIGVMMVYDKPPFAIIGRKSKGINTPKDLEGSVLGAPPPDGAWAQFPAFAEANDLDVSKIKVEPVGFPTREPMLAEGNVDAVTGFSFSSFLNLVRLGVPEDDISTILMADHGLELYGNTIIVNTIADPTGAIESLKKRNPALDSALEERRLQLSIDANVLTDYTAENGMGGVDDGRMARGIQQLSSNYEFEAEGDFNLDLYFTDRYLPAAEDRMLK